MNQIYVITNKANGKKYVGLTTQSVARRWSEHVSRFNLGERDHKLYQAMRKHGLDNFSCEPLCSALDVSHLADLEVHFIEKFDSFNNGYNMTCGDDVVSDETRQKLREIMTGRKITWAAKMVATRRAKGAWPCGRLSGSDNPKSKYWLIRHPNGKEEVVCSLRGFCKSHSLDHKTMLDIPKGKQRHHKGFVLLARFNDYRESEYTQAGGSGARPVARTG